MNVDAFREALEREGVVIFSLKDAARIIRKPPSYTKLFLSRLAKRGKILRVERGKYCLRSTSELEVASNLVYPSYISFLSALAFHKLTTQIPVQVQVACARQKENIIFGNVRIEFVKLKKSALFGFKRVGNVFVAEPEKAIIDGLYLPGYLPLSEIFYALKQGELEVDKLREYADRLGSSVVKRRIGFLLERAGVKESISLKNAKSTRYALLNPLLTRKGKKNRKWMLLINEVLE